MEAATIHALLQTKDMTTLTDGTCFKMRRIATHL